MKKILVKTLIGILSVLIMISLAACANDGLNNNSASNQAVVANDEDKTRTITDFTGTKVELPGKVTKVATAWDDFNSSVLVCGDAKEIVATANIPGAAPWLYKVFPCLSKALATFNGDFNIEDVMKNKPDLIYVTPTSKIKQKLIDSGIPVVQVKVTSFDELKKSMTVTGDSLGGDAVKKAADYNKYFDDKIKMIKSVTDKIPADQKLKVLHLQGTVSPVVCDGTKSTIDDWITTSGGINAAQGAEGTVKQVSMEQVIKWNPDVIILGTSGDNGIHTGVDQIYNDPKWKDISAVKNHRVYVNPNGMYMWDRNCPEEALQIQWAAKTLYPDLFKNLDVVKETKSFYKKFFNYNLSNDDAQRIIKAEPPK